METFLPIDLGSLAKEASKNTAKKTNYILEPDKETLLAHLIPKMLQVKMYAAHVNSVASEHAARVTAMQIATDNANDFVEELTLEYNKMRQQAITNELLDIMGGTIGK